MAKPEQIRAYQHHHMDSTRWDQVERRDGDIIITTAYKAGTTWMQAIVGALLFAGREKPAPVWQMSPWVDFRPAPLEPVIENVNGQRHRRFLKTHLPLSSFPYREGNKYIYVARDGRDVFMSLWNHYTRYTEEAVERMNAAPGLVGDPFEKYTEDIHELFRNWLRKGAVPWENDGYPFWSFFEHLKTWWEYRDLPNILWVHYNDLLEDLEGGMKRIAAWLEIEVEEGLWPALVKEASFETMRDNSNNYVPSGGRSFDGGGKGFLHKGTNRRWEGVLTPAELKAYEDKTASALTPDCARWLAEGGELETSS